MRCGARHPEQPIPHCTLPETMAHARHCHAPSRLTWPNLDFVAPPPPKAHADPRGATQQAHGMAKRAAGEHRVGPPPSPAEIRRMVAGPNVRAGDPVTAHDAARLYEPKRDTARGRVLAHLRAHLGQWIDAPEFATESVGGFAGTRRLRELRKMGWPIDTRLKPGSDTTWQHRLTYDPLEGQSSAS